MRRLFSSFAGGAPGIGLLILRLATGVLLMFHGITVVSGGAATGAVVLHALVILLGVLLLAGLWTPIAGALVAFYLGWELLAHPASWPRAVPVAVMALALALLGPGAWSVDARLYGWKQITILGRRDEQDPPD